MANDRLYRPRRAYAGEHKDSGELAKDIHEELKRLEATSTNTDKDIDTAQAAADAAQTTADARPNAQQDGSQKTTTGETFSPGASTWADLPGNSGSGVVDKDITTVGGKVKASLVVNLQSKNANDLFKIRIKEDSTGGNIEGVSVTAGLDKKFIIPVHEIFTPTAGSHTYTAQGWTDVSSSEANIDMVNLTVTEIKDNS